MKDINENIDLVKWAFEKGYRQGNSDSSEGIYIDFSEIQRCFLDELVEFKRRKDQADCPSPVNLLRCN
ncbi:MAG: hypothetical protein ACI9LM_005124 [Alteromonadaceae bacterium]|jgi:hypothetical protein